MSQLGVFADIVRKLGRAARWLVTLQLRERTVGRPTRWSGTPEPLVGPAERSFSDLLEMKAVERGDEPFLRFYGQTFSLRELNRRSNQLAHRLLSQGASPGQNAAIMMGNSPQWLIAFYALQKLGMCAIPVNTHLRDEQLRTVLGDTEARFIFIDHELLGELEKVRTKLVGLEIVIVQRDVDDPRQRVPEWGEPMERYLDDDLPDGDLNLDFDRNNACLIMYTSGTTGMPKGVVSTYARSGVTLLGIAAHVFYEKEDVLYTCLPLYHPNALFFTVTEAMWRDLKVGLGRGFYPESFWGEVRMYRATVFSALGSMMSVLMKQPRKPNDRENPVRIVFSSGCPSAVWHEFEERFDVKVYEGYDAVDNGGFATFNMGNAPVGSIGRPAIGRFRILDDRGQEAAPGEVGELVVWTGKKKGAITFSGDRKQAEERMKDGWLRTEDLVYRDENGFLYFAGRLSDLVTRGGEMVSTYRVEREIERNPEVLECAVYPVVGRGSTDSDIMVAVVPTGGSEIDPAALYRWMQEKLPQNAVPRYLDVIDELPKTGTQWTVKFELIRRGVTATAVDLAQIKS